MTCAEFQRDLPYIIDGGGTPAHEEHLRTCAVCSDLVNDLKYIAEQAKLLVPMMDPSPKVWDGISKSLEREGLVKPAPARRGLLGPHRQGWGWMVPVAALFVFALALFINSRTSSTPAVDKDPQMASTADDADDKVVVETVAEHDPSLRQPYEDDLKHVNAYIQDAKRTVDENPGDEDARRHLMQAYEQKNLLYEMAVHPGQ